LYLVPYFEKQKYSSGKAEFILTGYKEALGGNVLNNPSNFSTLQGKLSQKVHGSNHRGFTIPTEVLHGISQSHQTNGGIVLNSELSQGLMKHTVSFHGVH
jgi:hypothetical protein